MFDELTDSETEELWNRLENAYWKFATYTEGHPADLECAALIQEVQVELWKRLRRS